MTHPWLTSLSVAELDHQLGQSQSWLQTNMSGPVENLASPMGAYNDTVLTVAKKYYRSHRTVNPGSNDPGQDLYQLNADGFSTRPRSRRLARGFRTRPGTRGGGFSRLARLAVRN